MSASELTRDLNVLGEDVHSRTIRRVAWAPSGRALAAASFDGTISVWEKGAGEGKETNELGLHTVLTGHENEVKGIAWSVSGGYLASCSRDKSVWVRSLDSEVGEGLYGGAGAGFLCVGVLQAHSADVKSVAWHPSQDVLLSCSYDNDVRVWMQDDDDWFCLALLSGHTGTVWDASFSPDGSSIVTASADNTLRVWTIDGVLRGNPDAANITEATSFSCVATLDGVFTRDIYAVDWAADSDAIVAVSGDNSIAVYADARSSASPDAGFDLIAHTTNAHDADINTVAWIDASTLVTGSDDGYIKTWRLTDP